MFLKYHLPLLVAMDEKRCIGVGGKLPPWRLPADMKNFKQVTLGDFEKTGKKNYVVMGRKTFESLPDKFKPLPGRINVVLTKNRGFRFEHPDCKIFHGIEPVLELSKQRDVFVVGGREIYKLFLPYVSVMMVSHVEVTLPTGDTFFPEINGEWKARVLSSFKKDEKNQYDFSIVEYTRRPRN